MSTNPKNQSVTDICASFTSGRGDRRDKKGVLKFHVNEDAIEMKQSAPFPTKDLQHYAND